MGFSRQEYWSGLPLLSPGDLPNPGIEPRSPTLQADSSPAEPPGKPKNTGVGSLPLLQRIPLTQGSNWGLPHCRWILHQLSCQGSPIAHGESEVTQSCPTLCDPVDCSLPGFSIHGTLQARILEWVTISFSRGSSRLRDRTWVSCIGGRCVNL